MVYIIVAIVVILVVLFFLANKSLTPETKSLRLFQILMKTRMSMGVHPDSGEVFFKSLKQYFNDYKWWTAFRQEMLVDQLINENKHDIARGDVKTLVKVILEFEYLETRLNQVVTTKNVREGFKNVSGEDSHVALKKISMAVENSYQKTYGQFFKQ